MSGVHPRTLKAAVMKYLSLCVLQEDLFQQPGLRSEFEEIRDCLDTGSLDTLRILHTVIVVYNKCLSDSEFTSIQSLLHFWRIPEMKTLFFFFATAQIDQEKLRYSKCTPME